MISYRLNKPGTGMHSPNMFMLKRGVCCDGEGKICQYKLTLATLGTITSITVKDRDGVDVVTTVSGVSNKDTLREAIVRAIDAAGGFLNDGGLKITQNGNAYTIVGTGEVPLVSLENGATRTFTIACTESWTCSATLHVPYGNSNAIFNGASIALTGIDAETDPADIKSDLDALTTPATNTVTLDAANNGFKVVISVKGTDAYFIGGRGPYIKNCVPDYTA